jgi:hypothetical protein
MIQPFKAGDGFADHARPISDIMAQLKGALIELENIKKVNPYFLTGESDNRAYKSRVVELDDDDVA